MLRVACTFLFLGMVQCISAQHIFLQRDGFRDHEIDRQLIQSEHSIHPSLKYLLEEDVKTHTTGILASTVTKDSDPGVSEKVYTDSTRTFYTIQNTEPSESPAKWWERWFFSNPDYLYSTSGKGYFVRFNPILHFQAGSSNGKDGLLFRNTRGLELSGGIDDRFFFFTNIVETQSRFAQYVDDYIEPRIALPGNGFYKRYKSSVVDLEDAYDYLNSTGYLTVRASDHVHFTFGHGRHFIGNGVRSTLLSDFTNNYFYLQADWKFWKIHYRNIWSEVKPRSSRAGLQDEEVRRKYLATHHLSIALTPKMHLGIFESVVFDRSDQFELGYLNPVILFRTVEQSLSSPDNVLLGLDYRWDIWNTVSLYAQVNFDEFSFQELIVDNQGWWANKYAWQVGVKYLDALGVDRLDFQIEWNGARPYTYTHRDSSASYSHSNMALAHPLGANFQEFIGVVRYSLGQRWFAKYTFLFYDKGVDGSMENYGGNILLPHDTRLMEYDNEIGQGIEQVVQSHRFDISYRLRSKVYLDLGILHRINSLGGIDQKETILSGGLRWNFDSGAMLF